MSYRTGRFGGAIYKIHREYATKREAQRGAKELRLRGFKARVIAQRSPYGGFTYFVWKS